MLSGIGNTINQLISDPGGTILSIVYLTVCILFCLILHECAHAYVALKCGDPTAKWMGRLTLNPLKHLDPIGTICMVFARFGWAKPVPVNPRNFRNYRRDYILVSLAGIVTNLVLCLISLLISAILAKIMWNEDMVRQFAAAGEKSRLINPYYYTASIQSIADYPVGLAVYSGQVQFLKTITDTPALIYIQRLFLMLAQMNLGLAVFNLIPVPPLDGYRLVNQFVFKGRLDLNPQTMMYIHIGFLIVCISGLLTGLLTTVNSALMGAFTEMISIII